MTFKKLIKFVEALPLILDYAKKVWDIIEQVITMENQETLKELK